MNPIENLVVGFQDLIAQVPEFLQPVIVLLAALIPFIEGEGGSAIGVIGGINPIVAGLTAATGNFLAVLVVVLVSSRARSAVVNRRTAQVTPVAAGGVPSGSATDTLTGAESVSDEPANTKPESKGRQRFKKWLVRFGVPGASLLGPLAIPTHFTSAMLIASGTSPRWVLLWQAVAIVVWTTLTVTLMWLAVNAVVPA
ncbi:MAG TPA: small multidrug efflux protein [Candidatus Ruania gallistercoris]|uniref:Small multidrug efflux protein n=1 Tax=Candidatus Ruania gallistercoris TaxID=2838746 RepID=A0A9D2EI63_9MICO|nr:small multidrug efflux protein [Candidatus Ruania gallistercoris]